MIPEDRRKQILAKYEYNLANASNRKKLLGYGCHFLDNSKGLDRPSIDEYIAATAEDYAPGTVNMRFRAIARMFKVNGLPWDYRRGEAPQIKERDEYRPELSPETIEAMVQRAISGKCAHETCFLALSSIYGLRLSEMAYLLPEDINYKHNAFYVATAKFGRERYHLIPPEIKPYLEAHDFNTHYGLSTFNTIFKRILLKSGAGQEIPKGVGWHAIRRALVSGLDKNGVSILDIVKFMRWRSSMGDMAMPSRYHGNVVVGFGKKAPVLNEAQSDKGIFEKHPFLPFWR